MKETTLEPLRTSAVVSHRFPCRFLVAYVFVVTPLMGVSFSADQAGLGMDTNNSKVNERIISKVLIDYYYWDQLRIIFGTNF